MGSPRIKSEKLEQMRVFLRDIAGKYTPDAKLSGPSALKAAYMQLGAQGRGRVRAQRVSSSRNRSTVHFVNAGRPPRDFWRVTPALESYVQHAFLEHIQREFNAGRVPRAERALDVAAAAFKDVVMDRFANEGGYGFTPEPLSPLYLRWKRQHGYPSQIGYRTGVMLRGMRSAKWKLRKIG